MVQGQGIRDYTSGPSERTDRHAVNRLDFKDGHFTLNGIPIEVEPRSYALKVGCHRVSYEALKQLVTMVKRRGPIEALDE